ncbi:MAG: hypothetical protein QNJ88_09305 [Acidimicrobiia bacterium]|nr:hypothetical protein [Acidimicrobiia bacterium]
MAIRRRRLKRGHIAVLVVAAAALVVGPLVGVIVGAAYAGSLNALTTMGGLGAIGGGMFVAAVTWAAIAALALLGALLWLGIGRVRQPDAAARLWVIQEGDLPASDPLATDD